MAQKIKFSDIKMFWYKRLDRLC